MRACRSVKDGYLSIGCMPCTARVERGQRIIVQAAGRVPTKTNAASILTVTASKRVQVYGTFDQFYSRLFSYRIFAIP